MVPRPGRLKLASIPIEPESQAMVGAGLLMPIEDHRLMMTNE